MVVILDTNILLSAIIWGGRLAEILPLCRKKYLTLAFSQTTFAEIVEKIDRSADLRQLALSSKAEFLVTGDKDLLVLKKFKKTKIVSPAKFLKEKNFFKNRENRIGGQIRP